MDILYPYIILFFAIGIEGELAMLTAAIAAHEGLLSITLIGITAFISTLCADWLLFFLGRYSGNKLFMRFPKLKSQTKQPMQWIERNPNLILLSYRFLYGFRIVTLIILGMSSVTFKKFWLISLFAIIIWSVLFGTLGYYMGELISKYIVQFESLGQFIVIGLLSAALVLFGIKKLVKKLVKG